MQKMGILGGLDLIWHSLRLIEDKTSETVY